MKGFAINLLKSPGVKDILKETATEFAFAVLPGGRRVKKVVGFYKKFMAKRTQPNHPKPSKRVKAKKVKKVKKAKEYQQAKPIPSSNSPEHISTESEMTD